MKLAFFLSIIFWATVSYSRCQLLQDEFNKLIGFPRADKVITNSEEAEYSLMLTTEPFENSLKNKFDLLNKKFYVNSEILTKKFYANVHEQFEAIISKRGGYKGLTEEELFDTMKNIAEKEYYLTLKNAYTDAGHAKVFNDIYAKEVADLEKPKPRRERVKGARAESPNLKAKTNDPQYDKSIINFDSSGNFSIMGKNVDVSNPEFHRKEILLLVDDIAGEVPLARKDLAVKVYKMLDIDPYDLAEEYRKLTGKNLSLTELHGLISDYTKNTIQNLRHLLNDYPVGSIERKSIENLAKSLEDTRNIEKVDEELINIYNSEDANEILSIVSRSNSPNEQRAVINKIMSSLVGFKNEFFLGQNIGSLSQVSYYVVKPGKEIDIVFKGVERPQAWGEIKSGKLSLSSPTWSSTFKQFQNMVNAVIMNNLENVVEIHYFALDGIDSSAKKLMNDFIEETASKNLQREKIVIHYH
ncbi:MAG: hypothetical protein JNM93_12435 [Bacteriovoracaceae bacterium]|nr:hypothetical protein [Bacteriovoracaceae bacterium]